MPRRDEEFHQIHIDSVILLPTLGMIEVNVQPSPSHYHNVELWTDQRCKLANKGLVGNQP